MGLRHHRQSREHNARQAWLAKHQPLAEDQQTDLGMAYHISLQAILSGQGAEQAWHTLACTLNIALLLCEQGHCAGAMDTIKLAQQAMMNCRKRAEKFTRYGFTGDEARQVMAALTIHDEQISRTSKAQITAALREVHRRIEIGEVYI